MVSGKVHRWRRNPVLAVFVLFGFVAGLCGCEVGRTMFQYSSSSSSPWVGIDLLPRKKKTTKISHKTVRKANPRKERGVQLALQTEPVATDFKKKPIRLDLPPSRSSGDRGDALEADGEPLSPNRVFDF